MAFRFKSCQLTLDNWETSYDNAVVVFQAGYFCGKAQTILSTINECPEGHYCTEGTQSATQHPCPAGTYNDDKR